jgi:hypothetical protein
MACVMASQSFGIPWVKKLVPPPGDKTSAVRLSTDLIPQLKSILRGPYKLQWLPSQKGLFLECLQAHQATVLAAGRSNFIGANSVPL